MDVPVQKEGILLAPRDLSFEREAVLNPSCLQEGNTTHVYYRAVQKGNISSIGYAKLEGPLQVVERADTPLLVPEYPYEKHGMEDPRVVIIDGLAYLTYTAYDGANARIAYAISSDLKTFEKQGVISAEMTYDEAEDLFRGSVQKETYRVFESYFKDIVDPRVLLWEKDAFLFPKKFGGRFALVHRVLPDMQIVYFDDFAELTSRAFWESYLRRLSDHVLLEAECWYETRSIGGGCPPIETEEGWLLIYHAVQDSHEGKTYHAAAALLDKQNPQKVLGRLSHPLFSPTESWEREGIVDRVVFPTGATVFDGRLYIYYGAADTHVAVASVDLAQLLNVLKSSTGCQDSQVL